MKTVQRGNKQLRVADDRLEDMLKAGYVEVDSKTGKVKNAAAPATDAAALKKENKALKEENKALKEELAALTKQKDGGALELGA